MGDRTAQIKQDIERARSRLDQNLNELQYRMKANTDWRVQFDRHPWAFVGAAFGMAFVLGLILARTATGARRERASTAPEPTIRPSYARH